MPTKKVAAKAPAKKAAAKKVVKKAVKKATKKAPVKKTTANKAPAKKNAAKRDLRYADDQTSFWLSDGQILNSLLALRDALDTMDDEVFGHHVSSEKNDFASWVETVLCDENCAKDLAKATSPKSAKTVVVKHLKLYIV